MHVLDYDFRSLDKSCKSTDFIPSKVVIARSDVDLARHVWGGRRWAKVAMGSALPRWAKYPAITDSAASAPKRDMADMAGAQMASAAMECS